jgi:hypothetical protein
MGWHVVSYARALSRPRHARVFVFAIFKVYVPVDVYDITLGCMFGIAHRELRTYAVSYSHAHVRTALRGTP